MRNAVNHKGWTVERFTRCKGWVGHGLIYDDRADAEKNLKRLLAAWPTIEFRVYEALQEKADA